VLIGDVTGIHFYVDNLTPGKWTSAYDVYLPYRGSVPADLYVGVDGTSSPGDAAYFGDKLYVRIYSYEAGNVVWQGWSNELATAWKKIASNTSWGDKRFAIDFYLDENFERQNVTNTDTEFYIYAVQTGGPVPVTVPYLTVVP
jgi:hypothetical protein